MVLEKEASALVQLVLAAVAADLHPTEANVLVHQVDSADPLLVEDHPQEDLLPAGLPLAAEAVEAAKIAEIDSNSYLQIFAFYPRKSAFFPHSLCELTLALGVTPSS